MYSILAPKIILILSMKDESSNRRVLVIQGTVNLDICDQFSLGCSWGCNFH